MGTSMHYSLRTSGDGETLIRGQRNYATGDDAIADEIGDAGPPPIKPGKTPRLANIATEVIDEIDGLQSCYNSPSISPEKVTANRYSKTEPGEEIDDEYDNCMEREAEEYEDDFDEGGDHYDDEVVDEVGDVRASIQSANFSPAKAKDKFPQEDEEIVEEDLAA